MTLVRLLFALYKSFFYNNKCLLHAIVYSTYDIHRAGTARVRAPFAIAEISFIWFCMCLFVYAGTPPSRGVFYLVGFLTKNQEHEGPPRSTWYKIFEGCPLEGRLFLRVLSNEPLGPALFLGPLFLFLFICQI